MPDDRRRKVAWVLRIEGQEAEKAAVIVEWDGVARPVSALNKTSDVYAAVILARLQVMDDARAARASELVQSGNLLELCLVVAERRLAIRRMDERLENVGLCVIDGDG